MLAVVPQVLSSDDHSSPVCGTREPVPSRRSPIFRNLGIRTRAYREGQRTSACSYERRTNCVCCSVSFGTRYAHSCASGEPSAQGVVRQMRFFEKWWERAPFYARVALFVVSIVGMLLGGAADGYWD